MRRLTHVLVLLLVFVTLAFPPVAAQTHEATLQPVIDAAADHYGVSRAWLTSTLRCESGGFKGDVIYGPTRGAAGEMGIAQLLPGGELGRFYAVGYTSPWDPSQAIYFTAWRFSVGGSGAWTCSWR